MLCTINAHGLTIIFVLPPALHIHTVTVIVLILPLAGAYLYYYRPGVAVNRFGGGVIIPLPSSIGQ